MVGYTELGKWGRLGNQMWEIAFLVGLQNRHKIRFTLPKWEYSDNFEFNFPQMPLKNPVVVQEKGRAHQYQEFRLSKSVDYDFRGYFQNIRYFLHCQPQIREVFRFKKETQERLRQKYPVEGSTCVHIRRGDYVGNKVYVGLDKHYYDSAISAIGAKKVLLFSDDLPMAQTYFPDAVPVDETDIDSMCLMSMCESHVVANSSFSFWGAWLSGSNRVVAPKRFYEDKALSEELEKNHYYPSNWKKI